ncbi:MAG: DUF3368 domain-containing protein [Chloroflexi bacterium]|nr:DUF3368 domain-containing protein [Chloroflexota bacterium]
MIVADSSPLISFARARKLKILESVCSRIVIPPAVYDEIVIKGSGKPGAEEIGAAAWIGVQRPKDRAEVAKLKETFGAGESEAIVLAEETGAILLVDEGAAIKEARRRGLRIASSHLILEEAKRKKLVVSVKKELDELIGSSFRTTPELIKETLQRVGEWRD